MSNVSDFATTSEDMRPPKRKVEPIVEVPEKKFNPNIKNKPIPDFSKMDPKYVGKFTPRMNACLKIINDFLSKKSSKVCKKCTVYQIIIRSL